MTISGNYPTPVQVNGYTCRNCTDVDYAKKHIDPAHPKSGPYNIDAKTDPTRTFSDPVKAPKYSGTSNNPSAAGSETAAYSAAGQGVPASNVGGQVDTSA